MVWAVARGKDGEVGLKEGTGKILCLEANDELIANFKYISDQADCWTCLKPTYPLLFE